MNSVVNWVGVTFTREETFAPVENFNLLFFFNFNCFFLLSLIP